MNQRTISQHHVDADDVLAPQSHVAAVPAKTALKQKAPEAHGPCVCSREKQTMRHHSEVQFARKNRRTNDSRHLGGIDFN